MIAGIYSGIPYGTLGAVEVKDGKVFTHTVPVNATVELGTVVRIRKEASLRAVHWRRGGGRSFHALSGGGFGRGLHALGSCG